MEKGNLRISYLGCSAAEIITETGKKVLIDPYLADDVASPIMSNEVHDVDLVLVTHGAHDHLGDAIPIALKTGAYLMGPVDVAAYAIDQGVPKDKVIKTTWGAVREAVGLQIRGVESHHVSFFSPKPNQYICGQSMSYIIYTESGARIYHSGDTSIFSDLKLIGDLYRPQISMILVGAGPGFVPELTPMEAAMVTQWMRPDYTMPLHFMPGSKEPEEFAKHVAAMAPYTKTVIANPGETMVYYADRERVKLVSKEPYNK